MYNLTERKITIGIYSGIFIIVLYFLKAFYEYFGYGEIGFFHIKQALLLATNLFLYIGLLILLYNIVVIHYKQQQLQSLWKWLIRLEVISAVLAVLTSLATYYGIVGALIITKLIAIIIYFIIFSRINKVEKEELPDIGSLQDSVISFYIILLLAIVLGFVIEFGRMVQLNFVKHLLTAIPFIFIIRFLIKVRKRIFYNNTASV